MTKPRPYISPLASITITAPAACAGLGVTLADLEAIERYDWIRPVSVAGDLKHYSMVEIQRLARGLRLIRASMFR